MKTVKLYTARGEFVAEVVCLPYQHWPQGFVWGERVFIRREFLTDIACTQEQSPPYYEASVFPIGLEHIE